MNTKTVTYRRVVERFRIKSESDFRAIRAAEILSVECVGKAWLNKLRVFLAHQGIALKDDNPPAYWLTVLWRRSTANDETHTTGVCPFTIVIDVNETLPFRFDSLQDREGRTIDVPTVRQPLYTQGLGDYSIQGMEHLIQIERKGDDLPSSLAQRREEFEAEIRRLSEGCEFAAVVIEQPWAAFFNDDHQHGARAKSIFRTVLQWQIAYPGVHWWFCDSRPMAEAVTFRLLERFWWAKQNELCQTTTPEIDDMWRI